MPPFALAPLLRPLRCSERSPSTPLAPDCALPSDAGLVALARLRCSRPCEPPRFRALLLVALVAAAGNAAVIGRIATADRRAPHGAYAGDALGRVERRRRLVELTLALDDGTARLSARARRRAAAGRASIVRGRLEPFDDARNPGEPSERAMERERGLDAPARSRGDCFATPGSRWDSRTLRRARARMGARATARAARRTGRVGRRGRAVGRTRGAAAGTCAPSSKRPERCTCWSRPDCIWVRSPRSVARAAFARLRAAACASTCAHAALLVWGFVWWSGAQLPAVRAATMATAALAARACGRATFSWNALAIAAHRRRVRCVRRASRRRRSRFRFRASARSSRAPAPLERWIEDARRAARSACAKRSS